MELTADSNGDAVSLKKRMHFKEHAKGVSIYESEISVKMLCDILLFEDIQRVLFLSEACYILVCVVYLSITGHMFVSLLFSLVIYS